MPDVSVIIPTYNRRAWIAECVDSVLAQTYRDFELIVVDDGSTDGTEEFLRPYVGRIAYLHVGHGGVSRARNAGFSLSRGRWIAFLDSDDLWLPRKLERQLEQIGEYPDCPLGYTDELWIRRGVRVNPCHKHRKFPGRIFERCLPLCLISPSSAILRRELFAELGGFDEAYPVCEDYELWLRVTARWPVAFLPEALIVKRGGHADQLSRQEWGMDRYRVRALQKILASGLLDDAQRLAAERELVRKCRILEKGYRKHGRQGDPEYAEYLKLLAPPH